MSQTRDIEDDIVAAIRRIIRAIDLQSRRLVERCQLTFPQLTALREAERLGGASIGALARAVHLSQPTVTGIVQRLEKRGLVERRRSLDDRRSSSIHVTATGRELIATAPSLLQERFALELARLQEWERLSLLAALERIASMMDAEALDAAPILETGPMSPDHEDPAGA